MTGLTSLMADSWISICGALGALIVLLHLTSLTASPALSTRFRACLITIIVLMTFRVGHWADWGWIFKAVTYATAALIPLVALLLAEAMTRRHAPKLLKQYCGWGAVIFVLLALLPVAWGGTLNVWGLMLFQLSGLSSVAIMVLFRDKDSLSEAENQTITRMMLSFLLILPFLATDFVAPISSAIPARLGGVAVLGLCLLTINLNRTGLSQRRVIGSMILLCVATTGLTIVVAKLADTSGLISLQIGGVTLAATMLFATWQTARALVIEDKSTIILREISQLSEGGQEAAIGLIGKGAGASDIIVLHKDDLFDFDVTVLQQLFNATPVRTNATTTEDEQLAWLFAKFDATHAVCISTTPMCLVLFHNPALMAADNGGYGIAALQRVAAQIAREDNPC